MHSMLAIVRDLIAGVGGPISEKVLSVEPSEWVATVSTVTPNCAIYTNPHAYLVDAQVQALIKKLPSLPVKYDLHERAVATFYDCEAQCANTNRRLARCLNWLERGFFGDSLDYRLYQVISDIRKCVGDILGPIPKDLVPQFSGGSTLRNRGDNITVIDKMATRLSVTPRAWTVIEPFLAPTAWGRAKLQSWNPSFEGGNRFTSVPKDSTKNRGIAVEPLLNICFQKAVGTYLRHRYSRIAGVHIDGKGDSSAQTRHREMARLGSAGVLPIATVDLSNASDTIAHSLVKLLLPASWYSLLNDLRSPLTSVEGADVRLQKFSSMGNGFTFELESILFYSIARVLCPQGICSVYGDDIIVDKSGYRDLISGLSFFGLTANNSKSFNEGPFRESCGGDFFEGHDVRPIYIDDDPKKPMDWINLHQKVSRLLGLGYCDRMITVALRKIENNIPKLFRVYGPVGTPGVLWTTDSSRFKLRKDPTNPGAWQIQVVEERGSFCCLDKAGPGVHLAAALLGTPSRGAQRRGIVVGYKKSWRNFQL